MTARMPKLTVVKTDGAKEPYLHTKVLGSIANALGAAGQPDIAAAQELGYWKSFGCPVLSGCDIA